MWRVIVGRSYAVRGGLHFVPGGRGPADSWTTTKEIQRGEDPGLRRGSPPEAGQWGDEIGPGGAIHFVGLSLLKAAETLLEALLRLLEHLAVGLREQIPTRFQIEQEFVQQGAWVAAQDRKNSPACFRSGLGSTGAAAG